MARARICADKLISRRLAKLEQEDEFMEPTSLPGSQKDPLTQTPVRGNPAPDIDPEWRTRQRKDNPADPAPRSGDTSAGPSGYLDFDPVKEALRGRSARSLISSRVRSGT